jgi:hypothetical protein
VVDIHHHAGPDTARRRLTLRQVAREYAEIGGWVVVKSHLCATSAAAWEAREEGLPVSGSVVLNEIGGGLDPRVVAHAVIQHGPDSPARLMVYLPTLTGRPHGSKLARMPFHPDQDRYVGAGTRVSDEDGTLLPDVLEVLRCARDLPVVLATGHCTRDESMRIVDAAISVGLDRLVLTHATHPMSGFSLRDLTDLADVAAVHVELTALTRLLGHHGAELFAAVIRAHPRVIYSSDLGQPEQPGLRAWQDLSADWFAESGLSDREISEITVHNPARLLLP